PDLVIDLTKVGSTLSLEEHQLHAWGRSASRGTHTIADWDSTSMKIRKSFANFCEDACSNFSAAEATTGS
ncbi:MAG TPA: hypothetical protein VNE84_09580, partial [Candidatus Limnocylindria bacterium]|nr:hypothetical protein [Candidatus Limnocylindria bacterium]